MLETRSKLYQQLMSLKTEFLDKGLVEVPCVVCKYFENGFIEESVE